MQSCTELSHLPCGGSFPQSGHGAQCVTTVATVLCSQRWKGMEQVLIFSPGSYYICLCSSLKGSAVSYDCKALLPFGDQQDMEHNLQCKNPLLNQGRGKAEFDVQVQEATNLYHMLVLSVCSVSTCLCAWFYTSCCLQGAAWKR